MSVAAAPSAREERRKPNWLTRLLLVGLSLVLSIVAIEVGLRVVYPQPLRWLTVYTEASGLPYALRPGAVQENVGDGWDVYVNGDGYRARSVDDVTSLDEPFLLAVGDSFAFAHGVDYPDGFVAALEERFPRLPVVNAAVPGYGPVEYAKVVRRHLKRPGIRGVLAFTFLGNDFQDCRESEPRAIHNGALGAGGRSLRYWLKANSHFYRFFSEHSLRDVGNLASEQLIFTPGAWAKPPLSDVRQTYADSFQTLARVCGEANVPLFVVVLPAYYDEEGKTNPHDIHGPIRIEVFDRLLARGFQYGNKKLPGRQAASIFEQLGIPFADVSEALETLGRSPYIPTNGHYTPEANRLVADFVAKTAPELFAP